MPLNVHTVRFPPAQQAALRRLNRVLARAPRLRTDPWLVEAGQRLSNWLDAASARITPLTLTRRGVSVEVVRTDGDLATPVRVLRPEGVLVFKSN